MRAAKNPAPPCETGSCSKVQAGVQKIPADREGNIERKHNFCGMNHYDLLYKALWSAFEEGRATFERDSWAHINTGGLIIAQQVFK